MLPRTPGDQVERVDYSSWNLYKNNDLGLPPVKCSQQMLASGRHCEDTENQLCDYLKPLSLGRSSLSPPVSCCPAAEGRCRRSCSLSSSVSRSAATSSCLCASGRNSPVPRHFCSGSIQICQPGVLPITKKLVQSEFVLGDPLTHIDQDWNSTDALCLY